jgi:hypothetical protein
MLTAGGRDTLRTYLRALEQSPDAEYYIKYDRGIARSGGLDLKDAVSQLDAFHGVHEGLGPELRRLFPLPPMRRARRR